MPFSIIGAGFKLYLKVILIPYLLLLSDRLYIKSIYHYYLLTALQIHCPATGYSFYSVGGTLLTLIAKRPYRG